MKLFKIRVNLHYTNSKSFVAGYPDIYVAAENEEQARKKAYSYKEGNNTKVDSIRFVEEITNFIF